MTKLVKKINEYWGIYDIDGELFVAPIQSIYCPYCGEGTMFTHRFMVYYHREVDHYHIDVNAKCLVCDHFSVWGLPIPEPKEIYNKLRNSKYHGKTLRHELPYLMEKLGYKKTDISMVKRRLESWGYW